MWNCTGDCSICLQAYGDEGQKNDTEYRKYILQACQTFLVSELGVEWGSISTDEYLPFCAQCLESIEQMSRMDEDSEKLNAELKASVTKFMLKAIKVRRQNKEKGITLPASLTGINSIVKTEPTKLLNCVACFDFYRNEMQNEQLTPQAKETISKNCLEFFFTDYISNSGGFDWKTIASRELTPFCPNCFLTIKKISDLATNYKNTHDEAEEFVDRYLVELFTGRDKKKKSNKDRNSISMNSPGRSLSVVSGKTIINVNSRLPVFHDTDYVVSASSDVNGSSYSGYSRDDGPRIINTSTRTIIDAVSSTNPNGTQSEPCESGGLPVQRTNTISKNQHSKENVVVAPSRPSPPTNTIVEGDQEMELDDVSNLLPPGTSIEELPSSRVATHGSSENTYIQKVQKPRKRRPSRFSLSTKIRTRSKCEKCHRDFTYEAALLRHRQTCGVYSLSELSFPDMPQLQVEYSNYPDVDMETVSDVGTFTCPHQNCEEKYQTRVQLEDHVALHSETAGRPHKCRNCGKSFIGINHLTNHYRSCAPRNRNPSTPANWASNSTARKQVNQTPLADSNIKNTVDRRNCTMQCNYCTFTAKNSTVFSKHLQSHYDEAAESRCTTCRHVYSNKGTLKRHMLKAHPSESGIPLSEEVQQLLNPATVNDEDDHTEQTRSRVWVKSGFVR